MFLFVSLFELLKFDNFFKDKHYFIYRTQLFQIFSNSSILFKNSFQQLKKRKVFVLENQQWTIYLLNLIVIIWLIWLE